MDGRRLKFLNIVDEYSRLCLVIHISRRCKAIDVIDTIEELLKQYPAPTHLRMDNGPEFIAHALQEWCTGSGSSTVYIAPGSPWENPFVESFNSRFRDEFLNIELFASVPEARLLAEQYRMEYNTYRPHSALQGRTPLETLLPDVNYVGGFVQLRWRVLPAFSPLPWQGGGDMKTEPPSVEKTEHGWGSLIGIRRRQSGWPVPLLSLCPIAATERTSRWTPQSAGSAELVTGSSRQGCGGSWRVIDAWSGRPVSQPQVGLCVLPACGGSSRH